MKKYLGKIIDIHSHILPCVDDGSSSFEKSISLLKKEVEEGVTDIILTPHYRQKYTKTAEQLQNIFDSFCIDIKKENIPVNLYLGQEIFYSNQSKELIKNGKLLTLNNSKYILLEFPFSVESEIAEVVYETKRLGYIPIVAHLERYSYSTLEMAREIKDLGGLIQINSNSVYDVFFSSFRKRATAFLKNNLVDFIASDVHYARVNCIGKVADIIQSKYGEDVAKKVFYKNAEKIINE